MCGVCVCVCVSHSTGAPHRLVLGHFAAGKLILLLTFTSRAALTREIMKAMRHYNITKSHAAHAGHASR